MVAAVIATLIGLNRHVATAIKFANYVVVAIAALATFSLIFAFGM